MKQEIYVIKVHGYLGPQWSEWLGSLLLTHDDQGNTLLSGPISDQSELHGILARVRDLGLPLLSLSRMENKSDKQDNHDNNY